MKKFEFYEGNLNKLRGELIEDLIYEIKRKGALEIEFRGIIQYSNGDDEYDGVIVGVNIEDGVKVLTYDGEYSLDDVSFDHLIFILRMVENDEFEINAEVSDE